MENFQNLVDLLSNKGYFRLASIHFSAILVKRLIIFGIHQKHKRSPRIKSALSHTALESVMVGGAARKIRTSASAKKLQA